MTLVRWNPWTDLASLHTEMDRLFSTMREGAPSATEYSSLPVDVRQSDERFTIVASVPGFTPEDVEVTFDDGVLTIRARHEESADKDGQWVFRERRVSSLYRELRLPAEVVAEQISAGFEHGVLTVTVPRAQKAQPLRIPVASGQGASARVIDSPKQTPGS